MTDKRLIDDSREVRAIQANSRLRAISNGGTVTLHGYAAVFDSPSEDLGGFIEIIRAGAFEGPLSRRDDVRALYDHDTSAVLGRTTNGSLRLSQDEFGLAAEIDLPDTQMARDVAALVKRGDVTGMSFGFAVASDRWKSDGSTIVREILVIDPLYEVSIVTFPAYPVTHVSMRAFERAHREREARADYRIRARLAAAELRASSARIP